MISSILKHYMMRPSAVNSNQNCYDLWRTFQLSIGVTHGSSKKEVGKEKSGKKSSSRKENQG
ncbi:MAG: hypothetical protein U9N50_01715, partial [Pseudomonadota bacterium]|nr:hypothetical protein [Pseudomonadota bacterium]